MTALLVARTVVSAFGLATSSFYSDNYRIIFGHSDTRQCSIVNCYWLVNC